jgi:hypothetical protein
MTMSKGIGHRIERVRLGDITIDQRVQRSVDHTRVDKIAKKFSWGAFGVPTLSRRVDGVLVILDGMHRIEAAKAAGFIDSTPQTRVHSGLSLQEEAALFLELNDTRKPLPVDLFRIGVASGDPDLIEMNNMIEKAGLQVANSGRTAFRAVTAMRRIFAVDELATERALDVCVRAWGVHSDSVQGAIYEGVGMFFVRYGDAPNADELSERLAKYPGGANALLGAARGLAKIRSVSIPNGIADIVVEVYNRSRRTRALPPWTSAR